jgi:hypothetical protein
MKSELQYEKFKYMVLSNGSNVNYFQQHLKKKAFQLFVDPKSVDEIKIAGDTIQTHGSILVWGSIDEDFNKDQFCKDMTEMNSSKINLYDILSVEKMIGDLIEWEDEEYIGFIKEYRQWSETFFDTVLKK